MRLNLQHIHALTQTWSYERYLLRKNVIPPPPPVVPRARSITLFFFQIARAYGGDEIHHRVAFFHPFFHPTFSIIIATIILFYPFIFRACARRGDTRNVNVKSRDHSNAYAAHNTYTFYIITCTIARHAGTGARHFRVIKITRHRTGINEII